MSTKQEGLVKSINGICYEEFSQILKVKYFIAVQRFFLLSNKTLLEVAKSFYFFLVFLSTRYGATPVIR